jgi:hypothetical protein
MKDSDHSDPNKSTTEPEGTTNHQIYAPSPVKECIHDESFSLGSLEISNGIFNPYSYLIQLSNHSLLRSSSNLLSMGSLDVLADASLQDVNNN